MHGQNRCHEGAVEEALKCEFSCKKINGGEAMYRGVFGEWILI